MSARCGRVTNVENSGDKAAAAAGESSRSQYSLTMPHNCAVSIPAFVISAAVVLVRRVVGGAGSPISGVKWDQGPGGWSAGWCELGRMGLGTADQCLS